MSNLTSNKRSKPPAKSTSASLSTADTNSSVGAAAISSGTSNTTSSSASASTTALTAATANAAKRPYRRSRRPIGYDDKSSSTTTTNVLFQQPLNVYDAIIAESQDLYNAAVEAHLCSRYKIASSYLLLLHTRLVGLGKRFDKSIIHHHYSDDNNHSKDSQDTNHHPPPQPPYASTDKSNEIKEINVNPRKRQKLEANELSSAENSQLKQEEGKESSFKAYHNEEQVAAPEQNTSNNPITKILLSPSNIEVDRAMIEDLARAVRAIVPPEGTGTMDATKTQLLQLPSNIEVDTAMMEHLARAAAELHAARKLATSSTVVGASAFSSLSPGRTKAYTSPYRNHYKNRNSIISNEKPTLAILQSPDTRTFFQSTTNVQHGTITAAYEMGVAPNMIIDGRNNNTAGLRNDAVVDHDEKETATPIAGDNASNPLHTPSKKSKQWSGNNTNDIATNSTIEQSVASSSSSPPKSSSKSGLPNTNTAPVTSISRKPVTAAINTVPYANCNVRSLLLHGASPTANTKTAVVQTPQKGSTASASATVNEMEADKK